MDRVVIDSQHQVKSSILTPVRVCIALFPSKSKLASYQHLPKMTTLLAPVRFRPVPPAKVEIRNIKISGS